MPRFKSLRDTERCDVAVVSTVPMTMEAFLASGMMVAKKAGLRVRGLCSNADPECVERLRSRGLAIDVVPLTRCISLVMDLYAVYVLWRLFRCWRVKTVHTHTPKAAFVGQIAAWLARVPRRINTVHGLFFVNQSGLKRQVFRILELFACRLANKVVCVSQEDASFLEKHCRLSSGKMLVQPVGVDIERFDVAQQNPHDRDELRRELKIPSDGFVVGVVARMVWEKGFRELFEAVGFLNKKGVRVYLLHVGESDYSRTDGLDPSVAAEMGIAEWCRFVGKQTDVPRYLAAMDVYCLPSYREGYPVSVMEAMAMGLPCVVTDIRGCREAVQDGQDGLVVPPRDSLALAKALESLSCSPERIGAWAHRPPIGRDRLSADVPWIRIC